MLEFDLKSKDDRARTGSIKVNGREASTPLFMPVATRGSVRTLTSEHLHDLGVEALITNAYHLMIRPGVELIEDQGGLHDFINWDGIIFTDSGGFQMIRSGFKQDISDNVVRFRSDKDGSVFDITPSESIGIQKRMGSDVAMCLDHCPPYPADEDMLEYSVKKTTRWAKECRTVDGDIFGISQGGIDPKLRAQSCENIADIGFQGYALGGLSIGEPKDQMYRMTAMADSIYPEDSPRYIMGLGSPADILECIDRGMDIFDSAYPTRNARHGTLLTSGGTLEIRKSKYSDDHSPIDRECECITCQGYSRAYLNHLCRAKELSWMTMVTIHNLHFLLSLIRLAREAIDAGEYRSFKEDFLSKYG